MHLSNRILVHRFVAVVDIKKLTMYDMISMMSSLFCVQATQPCNAVVGSATAVDSSRTPVALDLYQKILPIRMYVEPQEYVQKLLPIQRCVRGHVQLFSAARRAHFTSTHFCIDGGCADVGVRLYVVG